MNRPPDELDILLAEEQERLSANGARPPAAPVSALPFYTSGEHAALVDGAPPVGYLARSVWPADAHGIFAAESKAGKSWAALDLAVSVSSGTHWLGKFPVEACGRVLMFLGEGGPRKMLRRCRAICQARGVVYEELPIVVCFRVPHLRSSEHLALIERYVAVWPCALVIVDPLYLAARGSQGSDLYQMGEALEALQIVTQAAGAALMVVHHWNQTGTGRGAGRMSGAGPAEWGRVLCSGAVVSKHTDPESLATAVTLDLEFVGDEIPDTSCRIRRRVWADEPDELGSALHYEVEELDRRGPDAPGGDLRPAHRRVLAVLERTGDWLAVREIGDQIAADDTGLAPLKARTIQDALKVLVDARRAESADAGAGWPGKWRRVLSIGSEEAGNVL